MHLSAAESGAENAVESTLTRGSVGASPHPPVVDISGVSFSYGRDAVLENVSLRVDPGEFLAVIGPNGGGKTTLLRLILGLLRPDAGAVRIFGGSAGSMNRRIGYVPQFSTLYLDFPASVLDMVLMGAVIPSPGGGRWNIRGKTRQRAMDYLETLGLADDALQPVAALSGGQRQRALVARALMSRPEDDAAAPFLLLLDEPTASIDPRGKFCFYEFLGKLRGQISLIVVSHDLFMVSPFFNSIAVVNKGLARLREAELSPENLTALFGRHLHDCPVADLQHLGRNPHPDGCTHPNCAEKTPEAVSRRSPLLTAPKQDR